VEEEIPVVALLGFKNPLASKTATIGSTRNSLTQPLPPCGLRWGLLNRLPEDYVGERHVVIGENDRPYSSINGHCEFEERPGPAPPGLDDPGCVVYFTPDEMKI
jgi:hypothetical protein